MSSITRQWLLKQCAEFNIPAVGTNSHLALLVNKAIKARNALVRSPKPHHELPRYSVLLHQQVRVIHNGNSFDGLCIRNRADWKYQIMQNAAMLIDFDAKQIGKIEYRGRRWMVWL